MLTIFPFFVRSPPKSFWTWYAHFHEWSLEKLPFCQSTNLTLTSTAVMFDFTPPPPSTPPTQIYRQGSKKYFWLVTKLLQDKICCKIFWPEWLQAMSWLPRCHLGCILILPNKWNNPSIPYPEMNYEFYWNLFCFIQPRNVFPMMWIISRES